MKLEPVKVTHSRLTESMKEEDVHLDPGFERRRADFLASASHVNSCSLSDVTLRFQLWSQSAPDGDDVISMNDLRPPTGHPVLLPHSFHDFFLSAALERELHVLAQLVSFISYRRGSGHGPPGVQRQLT